MKDERAEALAQIYQDYQDDWVFMAEHALGHMTWSKQREIIHAVQHNRKVAVRAAHGLSKTFSAAEVVVTFFNLFAESIAITTAPIYKQVDKLLWKEIREAYKSPNIDLDGKCYDGDCYIGIKDEPKHYAYGFSTDESAKAEGFHSWDLLYVFDEAKGVASWMWDAAKGSLTGGNCKWLVISTTDGVEVGSPFYNCFQPGSDWIQIHLSAFDSPYVTGEKFRRLVFPEPGNITKFHYEYVEPKEARVQLSDQTYIDEAKDPVTGWGEESVLYKTKVLGQICDIGAGGIIRLSQTTKMFQNGQYPDFDDSGPLRGGVDIAWGGRNNTVAMKAKGLKVLDLPLVIPSKDLPDEALIEYQADKLEAYFEYKKGKDGYLLKMDITGGGTGLVSKMQERGWNVIAVNNSSKADLENLYNNKASEMWFEVARIVQDTACPKHPQLEKELVQRLEAALDSKGRRCVERKKDYIKRGFPSPDFGDTYNLLFHNPTGKGGYAGEVGEDFY
jgi:hypothetical protein